MQSCCICFSLRTGGIIIGILDLIGAILGTIGCAVFLGVFAVASKASLNALEENGIKPRDSFWDGTSTTESADASKLDEESAKQFAALTLMMLSIVFYVLLFLCVVQIIISSILLYGIRKNTHAYLKVWLIFKIVFLVISVLAFIVMTCTWGIQLKSVIQQILGLALNIYFIACIHYLRKEIIEQSSSNPHAAYTTKA